MDRRVLLLECDGCGVRRQSKRGGSIDELRETLATVGWKSDPANDRDACPSCLESGGMVAAR